MSILESSLDTLSDAFKSNTELMKAYIKEFREVENKVVKKESQAKEKFVARGKLLPRERINMLLDRGAPFLEISSLAGYKNAR